MAQASACAILLLGGSIEKRIETEVIETILHRYGFKGKVTEQKSDIHVYEENGWMKLIFRVTLEDGTMLVIKLLHGLAITHIPDFVDYVLTMSSRSGLERASAELLLQAFEMKSVNGTLYVPKEYGMYICR